MPKQSKTKRGTGGGKVQGKRIAPLDLNTYLLPKAPTTGEETRNYLMFNQIEWKINEVIEVINSLLARDDKNI